jgi:hypothetical protein
MPQPYPREHEFQANREKASKRPNQEKLTKIKPLDGSG